MQFTKGETLRIKPDIAAGTMTASAMPVRFRGMTCTFVSYEGSHDGDDRATIELSTGIGLGLWRIMPHCLERIKSVCMFAKEV